VGADQPPPRWPRPPAAARSRGIDTDVKCPSVSQARGRLTRSRPSIYSAPVDLKLLIKTDLTLLGTPSTLPPFSGHPVVAGLIPV
jgi:hypothetical protein